MTYEEAIEMLRQRKAGYQMIGAAAREDLMRFCRASVTCFAPDNPQFTLILEGRREVWLRIQEHLEHTPEQLAELYKLTKAVETPNA